MCSASLGAHNFANSISFLKLIKASSLFTLSLVLGNNVLEVIHEMAALSPPPRREHDDK